MFSKKNLGTCKKQYPIQILFIREMVLKSQDLKTATAINQSL